jgi:uncharacterized protein YjbK
MKKEIEFKYVLASKTDFESFADFLKPYNAGKITTYQQENFYFDTPFLALKKSGFSLRLRKENDDYILTAKHAVVKRKPKDFLSVRLEYEARIDPSIAQLIKDGFLSPLDVFATLETVTGEDLLTKERLFMHMNKSVKTGLQIIGSLSNVRTQIPIDLLGQRLELQFDHSFYPNSIEVYEIEIEFSSLDQAKAFKEPLELLFAKAGIKTYPSSSKSSRLYRILYKG